MTEEEDREKARAAARLAAQQQRAYLREPRAHLLMVGLVFGVLGLSMLGQPVRWQLTPAYGDLFKVLPEFIWGLTFTATSALLLASARFPRVRPLTVAAVTAGSMLTLSWTAAFLIRWHTSDNTTPFTFASFSLVLYILTRAAFLLADHTTP